MLTPHTPDTIPIEDLLHLRMSEAEAQSWLLRLTPEQVTPEIFRQFVEAIGQTGLTIPAIPQPVMDCCGTGGSGLSHFNTSTTVSFVLAAGGVPVVKFGNRAISSQSGSFDFLETLGFPAEVALERTPDILASCGLVFLYAPQCYPLLQPFNQLRRRLGVRTIFNYLGPLLNPVQPAYRVLGVSHAGMQTLIATYLTDSAPALQKAWVVHSNHLNAEEPAIGLDELACHGRTSVHEIQTQSRRELHVDRPNAIPRMNVPVHEPAHNVRIFNALLSGEDTQSPYYQMVCLNAGAGFYVAGHTPTLEDGERMAQELLALGKVRETFDQCRRAYEHVNR